MTPDYFWSRADRSNGPDACWPWIAAVDSCGYGRVKVAQRDLKAHRVAYEFAVGPIPDGLTIDHLCRNKPCVNPAHLEPVTWRENLHRAGRMGDETHCLNGHEFTPENTRIRHGRDGRTSRRCRVCTRRWNRETRQRRVVA